MINELTVETVEFDVVTVNNEGHIIQTERRSNQTYQESLDAQTNLLMVAIPEGEFLMGCPENEEGYSRSQGPQHIVQMPRFWMAQTTVTQAQWEAVAALPKINLSLDAYCANFVGENRPVEQVSWYEAREFCDRLSRLTQKTYRLPREAEWEYACRGNTQTPFHFGETLTTDLANYSGIDWEYQGQVCNKGSYGLGPKGSDRRCTTDVGSLGKANVFGLYDMHGNVREWCADPWHPNYLKAGQEDSVGRTDDKERKRVVRGGSWNGGPHKCRSGDHARFDPQTRLYDIGFRVVWVP